MSKSTQSKSAYFEIAQDAEKKWHWQLWSGNGRAMAVNSIPYERKQDICKVIEDIKKMISEATVIVQSHLA